jgi:two-component system LytT family response regulator
MIHAVIVDNERDAQEALQALLAEFCPEVNVKGTASSALEAIKIVNTVDPDLVFLDVEMPGGGGFDFLESSSGRKFSVVFTTAYKEYAIKAIKYGAMDYLLKPIDPTDLRALVDRILEKNKEKARSEKYKVTLAHKDAIVVVPATDIVYIRADDRYSTVYLHSGSEHTVSRNIKEFERELSSQRFFRVHKSYLINCDHVKQINRIDGGFIELMNGREIEISRRKKAEFLRFLKS